MEVLCQLPYLALYISSIGLFLTCLLYNKPVIVSKVLSWFCGSFWRIMEPEEGVMGNPEFVVSWAELQVPAEPICDWHMKWGQSGGIEPLTCGVCANSK